MRLLLFHFYQWEKFNFVLLVRSYIWTLLTERYVRGARANDEEERNRVSISRDEDFADNPSNLSVYETLQAHSGELVNKEEPLSDRADMFTQLIGQSHNLH